MSWFFSSLAYRMCDHATTQLRLAFHVPDDYNLEILSSLIVFLPYIFLIL